MSAGQSRLILQVRTVDAILVEADKRGAYAAPVVSRRGIEEVFVYRDGELQASIFRAAPGRLSVWRRDESVALVPDVPKAVQRALDPLRKQQRKPSKAQQLEGVSL